MSNSSDKLQKIQEGFALSCIVDAYKAKGLELKDVPKDVKVYIYKESLAAIEALILDDLIGEDEKTGHDFDVSVMISMHGKNDLRKSIRAKLKGERE